MRFIVLVKQVPDTEAKIKITEGSTDEEGIKWILSPFDEHALEEALRQKEKTQAEITALSLGPKRAADALRSSYALGVDKAVHIQDDTYQPFDVSYTATVLSAYLKSVQPDIIFTGHIAIDSQSSMVPSMIAENLGVANINNAIELTIEGKKVKVKREMEGGIATMESELPVVITAAKNLNDPRYPSLKGIMASKKKQIDTVDVSSLGVESKRIEIVSVEHPPPRPPARILEGETGEQKAEELVKSLREEAKVV